MTTLQQNRCGEWTLTRQGKHDDPFNQIELAVCFTHAGVYDGFMQAMLDSLYPGAGIRIGILRDAHWR